MTETVERFHCTTPMLRDALRVKLPAGEYALMHEVRDAAGSQANRSIDALAMSLWPSRGLYLTGIELKTDRGDWRRELRNPAKAESIAKWCHFFVIAAPHGVVPVAEVPTIQGNEYGPIDLLVGGTPCQSFSVAGLRGGMGDARGNLSLEFLRLADRARPEWLVWENVPGVLSSNRGRDFGSILGGMVELGYGFAYRILDAQYFGLAQRRRRVFVVANSRSWRRAAAVLFERASLRGDHPPRRETGQSVAPTLAGCSNGGGANGPGRDVDSADSLIPERARALTTSNQRIEDGTGRSTPLVPVIAGSLTNRIDRGGVNSEGNDGHLVPVAFDTTQITSAANRSSPKAGDPCHPLTAGAHAPAIAFGAQNSARQGASEHHSPTLDKSKVPAVGYGMQVRRLTPRECERLQGFPDDYTLIPYRGKPAADGPRYKALGNSMAVPVMRWIGERIAMVEAIPQ